MCRSYFKVIFQNPSQHCWARRRRWVSQLKQRHRSEWVVYRLSLTHSSVSWFPRRFSSLGKENQKIIFNISIASPDCCAFRVSASGAAMKIALDEVADELRTKCWFRHRRAWIISNCPLWCHLRLWAFECVCAAISLLPRSTFTWSQAEARRFRAIATAFKQFSYIDPKVGVDVFCVRISLSEILKPSAFLWTFLLSCRGLFVQWK